MWVDMNVKNKCSSYEFGVIVTLIMFAFFNIIVFTIANTIDALDGSNGDFSPKEKATAAMTLLFFFTQVVVTYQRTVIALKVRGLSLTVDFSIDIWDILKCYSWHPRTILYVV